ncbi:MULTISPECIES: flavin reductase family protein [Priestia]|uniref:flavin reductase family protein n=1 Tax=Priestia TaxID=2800373 RepID=UPI001ADC0E50|nr:MULTISPECIES: flavin reductase family protein [Priestia]MDN3233167.1 flavin reductase family protein [Priestia megaterium]QTL52355.1 flavin reductase family protein [Priestia aryabhattai]
MDSRTFRNAMGTFATGITVITTEINGDVSGMTANAFMSVSLDPKLIVVSIDKRSRLLGKIRESKKYGISILSEAQQEYSMIFAGQIKEKRDVEFDRLGGIPVLKEALLTLSCNVAAEHEAGDHILFIGEVTDLNINQGEPLVFYGGKYRNLKVLEELAL